MSDIKGICAVCNKIAAHACKICGRQYCRDHIDEKSMMCDSCRKGRKLG